MRTKEEYLQLVTANGMREVTEARALDAIQACLDDHEAFREEMASRIQTMIDQIAQAKEMIKEVEANQLPGSSVDRTDAYEGG